MPKLLLADDSAAIQRVVELTFAGEDVEVVAVSDGEQAIARIPAERPDIVLADIGTPKRSGYDVSAYVKNHEELRHIPVLLLAGAFEPVDQGRAEAVRCDGVLIKPLEPQQVIARVRELIGGAKGSPSSAASGVPRPVERLTSLKLVERRERAERADQPERAERVERPQPLQVTPIPAPPADVIPVERSAPPPPVVPPPAPRRTVVTPPAPPPVVAPPARAEQAPPARRPTQAEGETAAAVGDLALDDYFDRLDAAFASLDGDTAATSAPPPSESRRTVRRQEPKEEEASVEEAQPLPTIDSLLGLRQKNVPDVDPLDRPLPASSVGRDAPAPPFRPVAVPPPAPVLPPAAIAPPPPHPAHPLTVTPIEPPDVSPTMTPAPAPVVAAPAPPTVEAPRAESRVGDAREPEFLPATTEARSEPPPRRDEPPPFMEERYPVPAFPDFEPDPNFTPPPRRTEIPVESPPTSVVAPPRPMEPPAVPAAALSLPRPAVASEPEPLVDDRSRPAIADAFSALLAVELGEATSVPVRLPRSEPDVTRGAPEVTEQMIEEVANRVIQRLAPDAVRHVVVDIVADIAERLIREEIAKIRDRR